MENVEKSVTSFNTLGKSGEISRMLLFTLIPLPSKSFPKTIRHVIKFSYDHTIKDLGTNLQI